MAATGTTSRRLQRSERSPQAVSAPNATGGANWRRRVELGMHAHHDGLPLAVLEVLPRKRPPRPAWPVADRQFRIEPHGAAGLAQPDVELVVLVADQPLVEQADRLDRRTVEHAEVDGVDGALARRRPGTTRRPCRATTSSPRRPPPRTASSAPAPAGRRRSRRPVRRSVSTARRCTRRTAGCGRRLGRRPEPPPPGSPGSAPTGSSRSGWSTTTRSSPVAASSAATCSVPSSDGPDGEEHPHRPG